MTIRLVVLGVFSIFAVNCFASTDYYTGEAITTRGPDVGRHPYIIQRTLNPGASTISETVVSFDFREGHFKENSSLMKVTGNSFVLDEPSGMIEGGGTLTGHPWSWTFLRATFKFPAYEMTIVDYNFFAEPSMIMGHKDFYKHGLTPPFMQEDLVLHLVDKDSYLAKRRELLGDKK